MMTMTLQRQQEFLEKQQKLEEQQRLEQEHAEQQRIEQIKNKKKEEESEYSFFSVICCLQIKGNFLCVGDKQMTEGCYIY